MSIRKFSFYSFEVLINEFGQIRLKKRSVLVFFKVFWRYILEGL